MRSWSLTSSGYKWMQTISHELLLQWSLRIHIFARWGCVQLLHYCFVNYKNTVDLLHLPQAMWSAAPVMSRSALLPVKFHFQHLTPQSQECLKLISFYNSKYISSLLSYFGLLISIFQQQIEGNSLLQGYYKKTKLIYNPCSPNE